MYQMQNDMLIYSSGQFKDKKIIHPLDWGNTNIIHI